MNRNRPFFSFRGLFLIIAALFVSASCAHLVPTVVEEEIINPESPTRKIVAHQIHRWTTRPIGKYERRFDLNRNHRLDPDEVLMMRQERQRQELMKMNLKGLSDVNDESASE